MQTTSPASVIGLALALPEADRLQIAAELLASVKPPGVLSVEDPAFADEIRRRCAAIDAGTAELWITTRPWRELEGSLPLKSSHEAAS